MVEPVGQGQGMDPAVLERLVEAQSARKPIALRLDLSSWQRELISEQTDPSVFEAGGGLSGDVFTHIQTVPLRLVIIGAVHIAQYLAPMDLGFIIIHINFLFVLFLFVKKYQFASSLVFQV